MTRFQVHNDGIPQPTLHVTWGDAYKEARKLAGTPHLNSTKVTVERVQIKRGDKK